MTKMEAYGFDKDSLTLFYSYLKRRKQCVKINNNVYSSFLILLSGVPQGSILDLHKLKIDGKEITSEKFVKLLGIDIDNKLNFETHIGKFRFIFFKERNWDADLDYYVYISQD